MKQLILVVLILCIFIPAFGQETQETDNADNSDDGDINISVVATEETTQQMTTISREQIEKTHATDLGALLQDTVGVTVTRYGGFGSEASVNMRGLDSSRVAVLIDGVPASSSVTGSFDFNSIDLSSIDHIEIIQGGSDSKYNITGAMGGVINIVTTAAKPKGISLSAGVSNTGYIPGNYRAWDNGGTNGIGSRKQANFLDLLDGQNTSLNIGYGAKTWSLSGGGYYNRAGNHFLYNDDVV
jgi:vitamin B12 transporter